MIRKIIIFFLCWCLLNISLADVIKNYDVNITVLEDGKIDVVETIEMNIDHKDVRLGIIRDIPSRYSMYKQEIETPIEVLSVTRNGESENYWVEDNGDLFEIYTGAKYDHPKNYIPKGQNIYQFHWQSSNHIRGFLSYDELYFNAIGNGWQFPIEKAKVTLVLPNSVKAIQSAGYYGQAGDNSRAIVTEVSPQKIEFIAPEMIGNGQGLTIATGFTKGIIPSNDSGYIGGVVEKILSYFPSFVQPIHIALMGILIVMFCYWLLGALIYVYRKPKSLRAFVVRFSPPEFSLYTLMFLAGKNYMGNVERFRVAFLVDLAHKGLISFNQSEKTIEIKPIIPNQDKSLTQGQREFLSVMEINGRSKVSYAKYNPILESALKLMTERMIYDGSKYYRPLFPFFALSAFILWGICFTLSFTIISGLNYLIILFAFFGCLILWIGLSSLLDGRSFTSVSERIFWCIVLLFFGSIFSIMPLMFTDLWGGFSWSANFKASVLVIVIILLFNTVIAWYGKIMVMIRPEYCDDQQKVLEFKHFLEYTKADEYHLITPDLFEEYLPYAIIFDVDKKWLALYKKLYSIQYENRQKIGVLSARSISSSSSFKTASAKPSSGGNSGRGSGSGGGGSSGGGSGGGGGRGR
ncbi:DUF2207 domain-containing protein [Wohlfahrtiimonas larvae]|uniref:DUF2207 domain-containing protein n=1 Tax=Wohlfahrtiimonas larvae TaxID=1157986 RepID=A0ABP9MY91_9GAMM|nr:DUF2207 domain-containing protein [Wohlfahrtiimonas larvae]